MLVHTSNQVLTHLEFHCKLNVSHVTIVTMAKQHRFLFNNGDVQSKVVFELVHMDLWGDHIKIHLCRFSLLSYCC